MSHYEFGSCPRCGQRVMLSQADYRSVLTHSTPRKHRDGCKAVAAVKGLSGWCPDCGFDVYKDGRACQGAGRVATEKRKKRKVREDDEW